MPHRQGQVQVLPAVPRWQRYELPSGATMHQAAIRPDGCTSLLWLSVLVRSSGAVSADIFASGAPIRSVEVETLAQGQRWCIEHAQALLTEAHQLLQALCSG